MRTIVERAKEYASKKADISLSPVYNEALASIYEEGYIAGAVQQKAIDIEKSKLLLIMLVDGYLMKCLMNL